MSEPAYRHVKGRTEQGVLVLTVTPAQLHADAVVDGLRRDLVAAVEQAGAKKIVLDFQRVQSLGSAAFRPLLSLRRRLHEVGGALVLCNLSNAVAQAFHATRLISSSRSSTAAFEIRPNVAEAVASLTTATEEA